MIDIPTKDIAVIIALIVGGYLCGSLAFGYYYFKRFDPEHRDIRTLGSHGTGASAVMREMGTKDGIFIMLLDFLKGFIPTLFATLLVSNDYGLVAGLTGLAAVIGHIFPAFIFKRPLQGGKGVSTTFGMSSMIIFRSLPLPWSIIAFSVPLAAWFAVEKGLKKASIASLTLMACTVISLGLWKITNSHLWLSIPPVLAAVVLVLIMHRANWYRVWNGKENKVLSQHKSKA